MFGFSWRSASGSTEGRCFVKTSDPEAVWTVHRSIERPMLPPHVELRSDGPSPRSVIIARSILGDRRLYRQVDERP
jgi:hypothetical protein